jgi:hypothetical protein
VSGERLGQHCERTVVGRDSVHGDDRRPAGRIPLSAVQPATVDCGTDWPVRAAHCAVHPPSMV